MHDEGLCVDHYHDIGNEKQWAMQQRQNSSVKSYIEIIGHCMETVYSDLRQLE